MSPCARLSCAASLPAGQPSESGGTGSCGGLRLRTHAHTFSPATRPSLQHSVETNHGHVVICRNSRSICSRCAAGEKSKQCLHFGHQHTNAFETEEATGHRHTLQRVPQRCGPHPPSAAASRAAAAVTAPAEASGLGFLCVTSRLPLAAHQPWLAPGQLQRAPPLWT